MRRLLILSMALLAPALPGRAERVKDITDIKGVRGNPLQGYGLVVGLNGTGDDSPISRRALANYLRRSRLVLTPNDVKSDSIASVLVTAKLPPFAEEGTTIDVTVSAIGSTSSLQGGTLMMTPLMGADGEVYAVAQGPIAVGGFSVTGTKAPSRKTTPPWAESPTGPTWKRRKSPSSWRAGR